jgi:Holliday junction resolvase RusA-like endonuclease
MVSNRQIPVKHSIKFQIVDVPPVKQASIGNHRDNAKRRKRLRDEALRVAKGKPYAFYGETKVRLTILYLRSNGKLDAANIIGGIADALQGFFYENDRQLVEIDYKEEQKKKGKDSYDITLKEV